MGAERRSLEAELVEVRSVLEEGRALLPEMAWVGEEQVLRSDGYGSSQKACCRYS